MVEKTAKRDIVIANKLGLHARPAALMVQLANKYRSEVTVERGGEKINGKSIMGIMMLAAGKGTKITVTATGDDAEEAVAGIEQLIKSKFGEE